MKKKLQVFISSTFSDLQVERQSAVEAVLRAGHIPAGMELFSAGNESQLEIIKRWIDESDIYMLILGGRYGSIEKESGLSYTEIEYRYALEKNKPIFAIVVSDNLLDLKVKKHGTAVIERKQIDKHENFKALVLSKVCRFFDNNNEIKLAVFESILDIQSRYTLSGWIKYEDIPDLGFLLKQVSSLTEENNRLKKEKSLKDKITLYGQFTFEELLKLLMNKTIDVPTSLTGEGKEQKISYLNLLVKNQGQFNIGFDDLESSGKANAFLYEVASEMMIYGLIEQTNVKIGQYTKTLLKSSNDGKRFMAEMQLRLLKQKETENKKQKSNTSQ